MLNTGDRVVITCPGSTFRAQSHCDCPLAATGSSTQVREKETSMGFSRPLRHEVHHGSTVSRRIFISALLCETVVVDEAPASVGCISCRSLRGASTATSYRRAIWSYLLDSRSADPRNEFKGFTTNLYFWLPCFIGALEFPNDAIDLCLLPSTLNG